MVVEPGHLDALGGIASFHQERVAGAFRISELDGPRADAHGRHGVDEAPRQAPGLGLFEAPDLAREGVVEGIADRGERDGEVRLDLDVRAQSL